MLSKFHLNLTALTHSLPHKNHPANERFYMQIEQGSEKANSYLHHEYIQTQVLLLESELGWTSALR